jgi:hypothetical protein
LGLINAGIVTPLKAQREEMAEASEQVVETPAAEAPVTEEVAETPEPQQAEEQTEREPGGSDGESVYSRRLHRENKQLKEKEAALQAEIARRDERLRLLEEQANKPAPKSAEPELTIERVEAGIRDGTVDPVMGQRWIARKEAELIWQQQEQKKAQVETRTRIETEVNEYMKEIPTLRDRTSKEFEQAQVEFSRLVTQFGYDKDDPRTYHTAIRLAHGPLDKFQKQREANQLTRETLRPHTEAPSGGTRDQSTRVDVNRAPDDLKAIWKATNTSQADQLKEYQIFLKRKPRVTR